jgi:hypothetical protein
MMAIEPRFKTGILNVAGLKMIEVRPDAGVGDPRSARKRQRARNHRRWAMGDTTQSGGRSGQRVSRRRALRALGAAGLAASGAPAEPAPPLASSLTRQVAENCWPALNGRR